jgi:hypothetical protein
MDMLRKHGVRDLKPGQRVRVRLARGVRGLTATAIDTATDKPSAPRRPERREPELRDPPKSAGERRTGLIGDLLSVDESRGCGVIALPELDDVAIVDIALLRAAGVLDRGAACGRLICDVEFVPPRLVVRCLTRLH